MIFGAEHFSLMFLELVPGMLTFYIMVFSLIGLPGRLLVTVNQTISLLYLICHNFARLSVNRRLLVLLNVCKVLLFAVIR